MTLMASDLDSGGERDEDSRAAETIKDWGSKQKRGVGLRGWHEKRPRRRERGLCACVWQAKVHVSVMLGMACESSAREGCAQGEKMADDSLGTLDITRLMQAKGGREERMGESEEIS